MSFFGYVCLVSILIIDHTNHRSLFFYPYTYFKMQNFIEIEHPFKIINNIVPQYYLLNPWQTFRGRWNVYVTQIDRRMTFGCAIARLRNVLKSKQHLFQ